MWCLFQCLWQPVCLFQCRLLCLFTCGVFFSTFVNLCAFFSVSCCVFVYLWCLFQCHCQPVCCVLFFSVNWCVGDLALEVVNPMTGRTEQDSTSRVSKQSLFQLYSLIASRLKPMADATPEQPPATPRLYVDAKALFPEYQKAKEELFKTFQKTGLGNWVKKPAELDQFEVIDMAA